MMVLCCIGLAACGAGTSADTPGAITAFMPVQSQAVDSVQAGDGGTAPVKLLAGSPSAGEVTLLAGNIGGPGSIDGNGTAARFFDPLAVASDAAGNLYVADTSNHVIRKVTQAGAVSTVAGAAGNFGSADGIGSAARFNAPSGIAVDAAGNLYIADTGNNTIRKITPAGAVSTLAGTAGIAGSSDGNGAGARFASPFGIKADATGNLYVADTNNLTVRKITPMGAVSTLAGTAGQVGSVDGAGTAARFNGPHGITADAAGNLYVTDTVHFPQAHGGSNNSIIRKITPAGVVSTIAGTAGVLGSANGTGAAAQFNRPQGIAADATGNLFVADTFNGTIRRITPAGVVTTFAGAVGSGSNDGPRAAARFFYPSGITSDTVGNLYVADTGNSTLRKITPAGRVSTLAGRAMLFGSTNGAGQAARFNGPNGIVADAAGNIYVTDTYNSIVRKITPAGRVSTLAGRAGIYGSADGRGAAAQFGGPSGIAVDSTGNLYVADTGNNTIRKITQAGVVSTLAGTAGTYGGADGSGAAAQFNSPAAIAVDATGNVYVADTYNHTVRKITPAGVVTTVAGTAGLVGSANGVGPAAQFNAPMGIGIDAAGNLFVADTYNHTVRSISQAGVVTTRAGTAGSFGADDGAGAAARFFYPKGVAIDANGNLYVADTLNHTVRRITVAGTVDTIAGVASRQGIALGSLPGGLSQPLGVALAGAKTLAVTSGNGVLALRMP